MPEPAIEQFAADVADAQRRAVGDALAPAPDAPRLLRLATLAVSRASELGQGSPDAARRACRAGCSACCHLAVSITAPEALLIAERLRETRSPVELASLQGRVAETSRAVSWLTIEQRALARRACALLDPAGACSIYEFRPLGCRGWTSFSKADCDAALEQARPGADGPMDRWALAAAGAITEGLERGLRKAGLDSAQYEFHSAVLRALEASDAAEGYARGEPVFAGCARVRSERLRSDAGEREVSHP